MGRPGRVRRGRVSRRRGGGRADGGGPAYARGVPRPRADVPSWAVASAVAAPLAMIGGWTVAAALEDGFDATRETISALAAAPTGAPWVMTAGLAVTGVAHVVTASGLRPVPRAGRVLLALGGLGTAAVAALPVDRFGPAHGLAAGIAFGALALWPAASWRRVGRARGEGGGAGVRQPDVLPAAMRSAVLRPAVGLGAAAVLLGLLGWFVLELQHATPTDGALTGLTERLLAGAQSLWPLVVVLALRSADGRRAVA